MNQETKQRVKEQITSVMDRMIRRKVEEEPFSEEELRKTKPFGFRVVPIEVWKGSQFERSFVTLLGQWIFEQLGKIIAEGTGATAVNQHKKEIRINTFRSERIQSLIDDQRRARGRRESPDLHEELQGIHALNNSKYEDLIVVSDLYIRRPNGHEEFYSFKTVKPNMDQTAEAKKNLLLLRANDPNCEAFFALPYNPAGDGVSYTHAKHTYPRKLFNMDDPCFVLIGSALWNKIGNDENTYNELLDIFDEVGRCSTERIRKEYLGL